MPSDRKAIEAMKRELEKLSKPLSSLTDEEFFLLFCQGCDFWSPDKERLECGCFKVLKQLVRQGLLDRDTLSALDIPHGE
jgi:hypothetical protein